VPYDKLILTWEVYPEADHYQVKLFADDPNSVAFDTNPTKETACTHPQPLPNGLYYWEVSAYNQNGREIATSPFYPFHRFTVTGAAYSIYLEKVFPPDKATVSGTGLTLEWRPYPGASYYRIFVDIYEKDGVRVVVDVKVTTTSYKIPQTLKPGEYKWSVDAFGSSGKETKQITATEFLDFTVK
jgi:hypothetical protein